MCNKFGWQPPYLDGSDQTADVLRLLLVLDTWGHEEGMARDTASQYLTGVKHHYLVERAFLGPASPAWGVKHHHHPLVAQMLQSIPPRHRAPARILEPEWIEDGFTRCWNRTEYVTIAVLLGWVLRVGEGCTTASLQHLIKWDMIVFAVYRHGQWHELPMDQLRITPCDKLDLKQTSRKYQDGPRPMPGRMNTCHWKDPGRGAIDWCHLCMPTLLQGWAILNDIDHLSAADRANRPVLAPPGSDEPLSRKDIAEALRKLARLRNEPEADVVPHGLRHTAISALANSSLIENADRYLRTVGHHYMQSSDPYVIPDDTAAAAVTAVQQHQLTPVHPTNL